MSLAETAPSSTASSQAEELAKTHITAIHNGDNKIAFRQTEHRLDLLRRFGIGVGADASSEGSAAEHILELGCGQGDCTVVLAAVLGEKGHVTALDPGPMDYGRCMLTAQERTSN